MGKEDRKRTNLKHQRFRAQHNTAALVILVIIIVGGFFLLFGMFLESAMGT